MPDSTDGLKQPFKANVERMLATAGGRIYLASGYRSSAEQFALRRQNGCAGREYDQRCAGNPITAIPGTSNHERGLAVDVHPTNSAEGYDFIHALGKTLNIYFPLWDGTRLRGREPWHGEPKSMTLAPGASAPHGGQLTPVEETDMTPGQCRDKLGRKWYFAVGDNRALHAQINGGAFFEIGGIFTSGVSAYLEDNGVISIGGRGGDGALWECLVYTDGSPKPGAKPEFYKLGGHIFPPG